MDSIGQALNSSIQVQNVTNINQTAALTPPFLNAGMLTNGSYPLTALYYASFPANTSNETGNATLDFVRWVIDKDRGQQTLSEVKYPSIYQENGALTTYAGTIINSTAKSF